MVLKALELHFLSRVNRYCISTSVFLVTIETTDCCFCIQATELAVMSLNSLKISAQPIEDYSSTC